MSASQKATRDAKAVRGEMHNVLALMRRFDRTFQIPPQSSAILKSFKILHDHMQSISTLATVPASTYLKPFLDAITDCISDEDGGCSTHAGGTDYYTAMEIAVHALASVNKFVLYGIINPDSRGISAAMQRISETLSCCVIAPSEADETDKKEKKFILLFKLLELTVCCLRSEVGRFLSDASVWDLFQTCFRIKLLEDISETLRHTAENTLAHVVLTIFRRAEELYLEPDNSDVAESSAEDVPACDRQHKKYGVPVLCKVLSFLISLTSPKEHEDTRILGLSLINIVLEMGGEALAMVQPLVELMQADLCKFLLQNSQTNDLTILSLTLRVVYNLFNSIKMHLKVQLEVFLTSVHLRIADTTNMHALPEQKELALESLLDFCQEQSLMYDLYINYDCDIQGTNLFENLCKCLCRVVTKDVRPGTASTSGDDPADASSSHPQQSAISLSGAPQHYSQNAFGVLEMLALDGLLAVVSSLSRRVRRSSDGTVEVEDIPTSPTAAKPSRASATNGPGSREEHRDSSEESELSPSPVITEKQPVSPTASPRISVGSESASDSSGRGQSAASVSLNTMSAPGPEEIYRRKQHKKKVLKVVAAFNAKPKTFLDVAHANGLLLPCSPELQQSSEQLLEGNAEAVADSTPVDDDDNKEENTNGSDEAVPQTFKADPKEIAQFFRTAPGINPTVLGDRKPLNAAVLTAFCETFNFEGMFFVDALREFLESFRLPGEAQKIDRCVESFAQVYFKANQPPVTPFANSDACFVLAFATVMLNTDQHNPTLTRRMKLEDFVRNNKTINNGDDLPLDFQEQVFLAIQNREIKVGAGVGDTDALAEQWDGVVKRSQSQAGAAFASSQLADGEMTRRYEKEMFVCIADDMAAVFLDVFYHTRRHDLVLKMLHALFEYTTVAAHFGLVDQVNHIVVKLCAFFQRHSSELLHLPPNYHLSADIEAAAEEEQLPRYGVSAVFDENIFTNSALLHAGMRQQSALAAGHSTQSRSILALQLVFRLARTLGNQLSAAWRNIVVVMIQLLHMKLLPEQLYLDVATTAGQHILAATGGQCAGVYDLDFDADDAVEEVVSAPSAQKTDNEQQQEGGSGLWGWLGWSSGSREDASSLASDDSSDEESHVLTGSSAIKSAIASFHLEELFAISMNFNTSTLEHLLVAILACRASKTTRRLNDHVGRTGASSSTTTAAGGRSASTASAAFTTLDSTWILCTRLLALVAGANPHRVHLVWPPLHLNLKQLFESSTYLIDQSLGASDPLQKDLGTSELVTLFPELRWVKTGTQLLFEFALETFLPQPLAAMQASSIEAGSSTNTSADHAGIREGDTVLPIRRRKLRKRKIDESRLQEVLELVRTTFIPVASPTGAAVDSQGHSSAPELVAAFCGRCVISGLQAMLCRLTAIVDDDQRVPQGRAGTDSPLTSQLRRVRQSVLGVLVDFISSATGLQSQATVDDNENDLLEATGASNTSGNLTNDSQNSKPLAASWLPQHRLWTILQQNFAVHTWGMESICIDLQLQLLSALFRWGSVRPRVRTKRDMEANRPAQSGLDRATETAAGFMRVVFSRLKTGFESSTNTAEGVGSATSFRSTARSSLIRVFETIVRLIHDTISRFNSAPPQMSTLVSLIGEGIVVTTASSASADNEVAAQSEYLRAVFARVLFPLVDVASHTHSSEQLQLRAFSLLSSVTLHHIEVIRSMRNPTFQALWLKLVGRFANSLQSQGRESKPSHAFSEAMGETLKNLILVMLSSRVFEDIFARTGENILLPTWSVLDMLVPTLRKSIEATGVDINIGTTGGSNEGGEGVGSDRTATEGASGITNAPPVLKQPPQINQPTFPIGCRIECRFNGEATYYPGHVAGVHDDNTVDIEYDDGDREFHVNPALCRRLRPRESKVSRASNGHAPALAAQTQADQVPAPLSARTPLEAQSAAHQEF